MNKTKEYAKEIMEDFIKRYPVPMDVQEAIDTLSDEDWKLYLKNEEYLKEKNG
jgi:aspartyl/asparaginyl beta-hydroxylase (cupin superfamily)